MPAERIDGSREVSEGHPTAERGARATRALEVLAVPVRAAVAVTEVLGAGVGGTEELLDALVKELRI